MIDVAKNSGSLVRKEILPREKTMAKLTKPGRDRISATKLAFPRQHKDPLENASHLRNAVARFPQVKNVTEAERRAARKRSIHGELLKLELD